MVLRGLSTPRGPTLWRLRGDSFRGQRKQHKEEKMRKRKILSFIVLALLALTFAPIAAERAPDRENFTIEITDQIPAMFIQNIGQLDERVLFQVWGIDRTIWLTKDGIWVTIFATRETEEYSFPDLGTFAAPPKQATAIRLSFVGTNPHLRIEPFGRLETSVNYFIGNNPEKWRTDVPVWAGVRYLDLYPGVDLVLTGENGHLILRLLTRPGADLSTVKVKVEGAENVTVDRAHLRLTTAAGEFTIPLFSAEGMDEGKPEVNYIDAQTFEILRPFRAESKGQPGEVSAESTSELLYSTFLGGSHHDESRDIAVDKNGNAYIAGLTFSSNFPATTGSYDPGYNGSWDAFIAKLNPSGSNLIYATFLGGSGDDGGSSIAVDAEGNAYVTGGTNSSNFPTISGSYDTIYNGGSADAFVVKLNPSGNSLLYSTFLGGSGHEEGKSIAVDSAGNAYITGGTNSSNFPNTSGAYDTTYNGGLDAFITKLNPAGSLLSYSSFLGGSREEWGMDIAVDTEGNAYVTGLTTSSDFPATPEAYDITHNGGWDVFVVKLDPSGGAVRYSTFVGAPNDDGGSSITVDAHGNVYITGGTNSPNFPTTPRAYDRTFNGGQADAFAVKLNPSGESLVYSTFLGGSSYDEGRGIAVDTGGNAYITGVTNSSNFPTISGFFDPTYNGGLDAFVVRLTPSGSSLAYSTFIGGSSDDDGLNLTLDARGSIYITGKTNSSNFPTTPGACDPNHNGSYDAFIIKLGFPPDLSPSAKSVNTVQVVPGQIITYTISLYNRGIGEATSVRLTDTLPIYLTYQAGSLWASAGTYGEAGGVITWTGPIAAGISVTVRFSAVVSPSLSPTDSVAIVNEAQVDDGWHAPFKLTAAAFINPRQVFLPLVLRSQ